MGMTEKSAGGSKATEWVDPDDAPELTAEFFETAEIRQGDRVIRRGRPATGNAKPTVTLRLDRDVLERWRASGPGWQTRAADLLRREVMGSKIID
jgi:uncharacterized protein (DUF4415 family)